MRQHLIELLKSLEQAIPPLPGQHHGITYAQYGCDETGWDDRLALAVRQQDDSVRILFLEDGDLEKPTQELVSEIIAVVNAGEA